MTRAKKCDTCRIRKVKCDEGKPKCSVCVQSGRICSYRSRDAIRFVNASPERDLPVKSNRQTITKLGKSHLLALAPKKIAANKQLHAKLLADLSSRASPERALTNPNESLALRWSHMIGPQPVTQCSFELFCGMILREVPSRLGTDPALDLAAEYTIDSHSAFMKQCSDEDDNRKARLSGFKAVQALRKRMINDKAVHNDDSILIAMVMHVAGELFSGTRSLTYMFHITALCRLLKGRWRSGKWGNMEEFLVRGVFFEELRECLLIDIDSVWDEPTRIQALASGSTPGSGELDVAFGYVMAHLTRLPRLVRLVRKSFAEPWDFANFQHVLSLAQEINHFPNEDTIRNLIPQTPTSGVTVDELPLTFPSVQAFSLFIYYHSYRIIISLAFLRLLDHPLYPSETSAHSSSFPFSNDSSSNSVDDYISMSWAAPLFTNSPSPFSDTPSTTTTNLPSSNTLEQAALRSASAIASSVPYALSPKHTPPWPAAKLVKPLVASYAAWNRIAARDGPPRITTVHSSGSSSATSRRSSSSVNPPTTTTTTTTPSLGHSMDETAHEINAVHAQHMCIFTVSTINQIYAMWHSQRAGDGSGEMSQELVAATSEAVTGGPVVDWMTQRRKATFWGGRGPEDI